MPNVFFILRDPICVSPPSICPINTNKHASEVAIVETVVMCYLLMLEVVKENKTIKIPHRNKR